MTDTLNINVGVKKTGGVHCTKTHKRYYPRTANASDWIHAIAVVNILQKWNNTLTSFVREPNLPQRD